ncbi:MAG TPA: sulfotransferase family 2 domain-containing protein [Casimicrobiaceae bacterium]|nr:sulfotransferase family 2 domain-containing protein [Casimicrobiaceae bacterium]
MGALRLEHRAAVGDCEPPVTCIGVPFAVEYANEPRPWLFLHVPKTAGSSVYSILRTLLKPPELLKLHPDGETLRRIRALPVPHRARLRMLYGHVDVHITRQIVPLQRCVTLLRDPVQRIVSYYAFARHMDRGAYSELARRASITQWIDALSLPETDNGMVRRFSGALHEAGIGACTRQMLERAKANLAQFAVVGLTSRFDEFYALLASRLGLPMRTYVAEKVNTRRPRIDQLDRGTLEEIERRNGLDRELYRFGAELFARQLASSDLSTAIDEFRRRCLSEPLRLHDAARRIAFARWKKLRRWSPYPFLG